MVCFSKMFRGCLGDDASIIKSIEESGVGIKGVYDFFACL